MMYEALEKDSRELEQIFDAIVRQGTQYLRNLPGRKTCAVYEPAAPALLPEEGLGTRSALELFNQRFESIMVASSGPRYWGFVTGGTTPAAIAGDWLTSIYDQNTQETESSGDISANVEVETIDLLLTLLGLPRDFFGGFVTGAMMSNFTCLAVARQWAGTYWDADIAREGIRHPIPVLTATAHSSALKALALLGIGSANVITIKTLDEDREAMDMAELEQALIVLKGAPCIILSSGGTVNTVDFDNMRALAALKKRYLFWWHVDAAFGGFAACSPEHRHLLEGWGEADSITVDGHKWLNVPYESAVFFIRQQYQLLQVATFQNSNAPYLGDPMTHFDYLNFLPENSRRLKALPAWFALQAYGSTGIRSIIVNSIERANEFATLITARGAFVLLAPVRLNTVCFTLSGNAPAEAVNDFLHRLNATGTVFMTPTVYKGTRGIRAAFVNWRTTAADVQLVAEIMHGVFSAG
jgi:glutamate/tyrosine decarboxylase-like PLP-dependent enzyme